MNQSYENVEEYLAKVAEHLEPLPDKDQILKELRAHIWDLSNRISDKGKGLSIQECFEQALMMMEDPKTLASKFLEEEDAQKTEWKTPLRTPETKVQNEQFIVLAVVGVAAVILFSWILQLISNNPFVALSSFLLGTMVMGVFILALYISDERLFKEQLHKLRWSFQRSYEEMKEELKRYTTPPPKTRKVVFYKEAETEVTKEVGFWGAFGEHLGGFIGGVFIVLFMAFLFYLDITGFPLFNENWYFIGALVVYISLGASLFYSGFLVLFGKIRISRLLSAVKNLINAGSSVILLVFYSFTVQLAANAVMPADLILDPDFNPIFQNLDVFVQFIIGITGIISFIQGLYDIFKFGAWKTSDRKSLI